MIKYKKQILANFQCQQSGNCCRVEGVVYASPAEITAMAAQLNIDIATFRQKYVRQKDGWSIIADRDWRQNCFLNDQNQCTVYKARPKHCKTYPDWPEIWASDDALYKEALLCPGLKKAIQGMVLQDA